jgi:hypothetical protein
MAPILATRPATSITVPWPMPPTEAVLDVDVPVVFVCVVLVAEVLLVVELIAIFVYFGLRSIKAKLWQR